MSRAHSNGAPHGLGGAGGQGARMPKGRGRGGRGRGAERDPRTQLAGARPLPSAGRGPHSRGLSRAKAGPGQGRSSHSAAAGPSVGPPHSLFKARSGRHVGGRVAVAALSLHHVALVREAGVEQRRARGGVGAWRQDARRRTLATHHGELVGASRGAVVQVVGGRAGLEGAALCLRRPRVGRRQVRVVARG